MVFIRVSDLWWLQLIFDLHKNRGHLVTKLYIHTYEVQATFTLLEILCFYKIFRLWPLVTSNDLWPHWKTIQIIYSQRATYKLSVKFRQLSLLEISCLQGWPPWKTIGIIYPPSAINTISWSFSNFYCLRYRVYKIFRLWPLVTSNDLWPPWKTIGIIYSPRTINNQVWSTRNINCLKYRVYKVFRLWPLVTSNDLWDPWKTIGIIYSPRAINIPSLNSSNFHCLRYHVFTRL